MQSERTAHAQDSGDVSWFASLLTDAAKCAQFVHGVRDIGQIVGTNLHQDRLFLCSTAIVALPLVGLHGWLLPLTPTAFAAFIPKESSIQALDTLPVPARRRAPKRQPHPAAVVVTGRLRSYRETPLLRVSAGRDSSLLGRSPLGSTAVRRRGSSPLPCTLHD
jgi:hypothetical protein